MSNSPDGGQDKFDCACTAYPETSLYAEHSYLVRSIKPNLIASHDWHVQPICQRSLRVIRLSGPYGSRLQLCRWSVPELDALAAFSHSLTVRSVLARTFQDYRSFDYRSSQNFNFLFISKPQQMLKFCEISTLSTSGIASRQKPTPKSHKGQHKISNSNRQNARALRRAEA